MDKICGEVRMVGNLTGGELRTQVDEYGRPRFVGSYRSASVLDALQVGNTTLLKARCHAYYRGTLLQFIFVHALLNAIGCWIAGMIIGIVIGLGQSAVPPMLGFFGGLGATWWMAYRLRQDHREAVADGG